MVAHGFRRDRRGAGGWPGRALDDSSVQWPYTLLGLAFALYGVALIWYGNQRGIAVGRAVAEGGCLCQAGGLRARCAPMLTKST